jgi:hypothetical protein
MKRYVVISDGKVVCDSSALDRAKFYAAELLKDQKGGTVSVFKHVTSGTRPDVVWTDTPPTNGEAKQPGRKRGVRGPNYTKAELNVLRQMLDSWPDKENATLARLALETHGSIFQDRTEIALANRLGKLRVGQ